MSGHRASSMFSALQEVMEQTSGPDRKIRPHGRVHGKKRSEFGSESLCSHPIWDESKGRAGELSCGHAHGVC